VSLSEYGAYLAAKKSVDDRALNAEVLRQLAALLQARRGATLRVLEIGAGLGTMLARSIELGLLERAEYTLLDSDAALLADARGWLGEWAAHRGVRLEDRVQVRYEHSELSEFLRQPSVRAQYDLLIANAVLDLVDVPVVLPQLLSLLRPGAVYWFSINFDGETILLPELPEDRAFMEVYHRSMDQRPGGDSKSGRHLFAQLQKAGASIAAAGSSDWVVFARDGRYPHAEAEFLRFIVRTIDLELQRHAEVEPSALRQWIGERAAQIDRGELVYIAHQLDFCGQSPR
jgi:SAM-dependent methyltransferase